MKLTQEELEILAKLKSGELDGIVGDIREYRGYKNFICGKYIKDGIPVSYKQSQSTRHYNGTENERIPGNRVEFRYDSVELMLEFIRKYGFLMRDLAVRAYSAKFKPKKSGE